ncbi:MAG: taurine dioxygenase [Alphaproteobacteria bacterium]|nr:taurine dioxygenase [Alphaproteobacteria bacterium]
MLSNRVTARPIAGALGAEIEGVDLAQPMDEATFGAIRQALLDHHVIFFRNQAIQGTHMKALASRFGPLDVHPFVAADREGKQDPEVFEVRHEPGERYVFGEGWHMDHTWKQKPMMGAVLYAREVPPAGGDTLFANLTLAYETMSDGMKKALEGLRAVHAANPALYVGDPNLTLTPAQIDAMRAVHPVVRTHPDTKKKLLFLHPHIVRHFEGWSVEESRPLIDYLCDHATRPEFTCRFRWSANDVAFWDNRAVMHNPVADYQKHRRVMWRVGINGTEEAY